MRKLLGDGHVCALQRSEVERKHEHLNNNLRAFHDQPSTDGNKDRRNRTFVNQRQKYNNSNAHGNTKTHIANLKIFAQEGLVVFCRIALQSPQAIKKLHNVCTHAHTCSFR